jgi:hypothetical protein
MSDEQYHIITFNSSPIAYYLFMEGLNNDMDYKQ